MEVVSCHGHNKDTVRGCRHKFFHFKISFYISIYIIFSQISIIFFKIMLEEVRKWLNAISIKISPGYLRMRLESHPDYPSIIAVQDTLGELGVECNAYKTNKEEVIKAGKPFLAHLNIDEGYIYYFPDMTTAQNKMKDFDKYWSGIVMLAERAKSNGNAEHDKIFKKEKQQKIFALIAMVAVISGLFAAAWRSNTIEGLLFMITNSVGLYFSWLITQKEFGISNTVSDKICSMAKHSRCESVLFSKGAKLFSWLTWGDIGIVYFSGSLLYIFISQLVSRQVTSQFYCLLCLGTLLFPFYSLYYQWEVVKQWCMLCLLVLVALMANALISVMSLSLPVVSGIQFIYSLGAFMIIFIALLAIWQLIKSLYAKSLLSLENNIGAARLKRNPEIFKALLQKEEASINNIPRWDEAVQFGNPAAQHQLVIACNPYCGPCAKSHQAIEQLYEKYPQRLSVAIRFALYSNDDRDSKVVAAKEIIKAAKAKPFDAIKDWYNLFDLGKFKEIHKTNGTDVGSVIEKHIRWSKEAGIKGTPTFFLNGRKIPDLYNSLELVEVLEFELNS
jgi:protein-disulfide isomerase/uncharacterized membrane protein